ncbi:hypothetical protein STEG23_027149 [Scotinomys teguina]
MPCSGESEQQDSVTCKTLHHKTGDMHVCVFELMTCYYFTNISPFLPSSPGFPKFILMFGCGSLHLLENASLMTVGLGTNLKVKLVFDIFMYVILNIATESLMENNHTMGNRRLRGNWEDKNAVGLSSPFYPRISKELYKNLVFNPLNTPVRQND